MSIQMQVRCPGCSEIVDVDLNTVPGKPRWGKLVEHKLADERPWSRPHANTYVSGLIIQGPICNWSGVGVTVELDRQKAKGPRPVVKRSRDDGK